MDDVVGEVAEVAEDIAELLEEAILPEWMIEAPPFSEWLSRTMDLFSMILAFIMDTPLLRLFAVFGAFWVAVTLCLRLLRTGRGLSR